MTAVTTHPEPIQVPMSDGTTLAAVRFPAPTGPAPAIVVLTPYRKEPTALGLIESALGRLGYEIVVADVRGLGGSGGDWDGPLSPREISDGVELLEWIAAQDFCDGQTALQGTSYKGLNTLLIAARRPRGLRCVISVVPPVDVYRDMWHRGGIQSHTFWGNAVGSANQHRPETQEAVLHDFYLVTSADPFDGERCRSRSVEYVLDEIEAPVLLIGGWYDYFLRGTLRAFHGLRAPRRLLVGNWGHDFPDIPEVASECEGWLAHWFRGEGADPGEGSNVVVQTVGTDRWETADHWPTPETIDFERWPLVDAPTVVRTVSSIGEVPSTSTNPPQWDTVWCEVWTTTAAPVVSPTVFRGPVALRAVISSPEAVDLDLYARISIVRTDGTVLEVTEGRLRASHRAVDPDRSRFSAKGELVVPWHPHDRAEPLPLDEPVTLDIEIFPINLELSPGESLRLGITVVRADRTVAPTRVSLLPPSHVLLPRSGA